MKPGWQSSEFWITLMGQGLTLLALTGAINVGDKEKLETALANTVTALFTIIGSTIVVIRYIRSRSELKSLSLATGDQRGPNIPALFPLLALAALLWAAPVQAAPPAKTCLIIGRPPQHQSDPALLAALQQLAQNQQTIIGLLQQRQAAPAPAPTAPIVIVMPQQQIPLGGSPRQDIPLGGPPRQDIPLGGPPKQDIPLGGAPRQDIPLGTPPRQDIPLGEPKPFMPPAGDAKPAPMKSQRYSPTARR